MDAILSCHIGLRSWKEEYITSFCFFFRLLFTDQHTNSLVHESWDFALFVSVSASHVKEAGLVLWFVIMICSEVAMETTATLVGGS